MSLPIAAVVFLANVENDLVEDFKATRAVGLDVLDVPVAAVVFGLGLARCKDPAVAAVTVQGVTRRNSPIDLVSDLGCRLELLRHG